jgi:DNA-directed RNA polymerase beta subunit
MSVLAAISTPTSTVEFTEWLFKRSYIMRVIDAVGPLRAMAVPVFINNGLVGYTLSANELTRLVKLMKWTGCLSASVGIAFFIRDRRILLNFDEGRPGRPLLHMEPWGPDRYPKEKLAATGTTWRDMIMGSLPQTQDHGLSWTGFVDPLKDRESVTMKDYIDYLSPYSGLIEYVDPYEQNETYIANFESNIKLETTHMEIHPSTILSFMTTLIPFCNHNQSVRNQLGDSQSKQGLSLYATNWQNRFDNTANVICYGEGHLTGTIYSKYVGEGRMPYGQNIMLAIAPSGYNQDDGFVFNATSFQRGLFRSINYRSYHIREEEDEITNARQLY